MFVFMLYLTFSYFILVNCVISRCKNLDFFESSQQILKDILRLIEY